ncbi:hypothetical protein LTR91_008513 [Friedmanniomyces endolithicus]|nr:hypothetical protein LTS00_014748 [Friedmanniomyces endolithicus]KAK0288156.1 hypothetical protein LTR35_003630 [Friedmanniomyces endolithicus]KAK0976206.1 hypothetical protein LTR54_016562 [Friedmanniomyces endolithicus]KAK0987729.1 hypothetical protein LTS01_009400 [Friedmanniomyces endolithicus]KAK0991488.1 hypothetical protein LTR91_008513 [Friedmanniomyces endolithicus]
MGLFVARNGHYQGWLAALLCCIAAVGDDESPEERERRTRTITAICYQEPITLTALPRIPTAPGSFTGEESGLPFHPPNSVHPLAAQAPSLKPLELGDSLLRKPRPRQWKQESLHGDRTSQHIIGPPTAFRRVEHTEGQRASLIPLRLGPVVLSNPSHDDGMTPTTAHSATANSHQRTDSTQGLLSQSKPDFYGAQRDSPFQRCQQLSTTALSSKTSASSLATVLSSPNIDLPASRPRIVRLSSSSSLHRQALETRAASVERLPLKRQRSPQNVRKLAAEPGDSRAEKEILELNTIVEERRTEQTRVHTPSPQHVAAIAPAMEVRARKETLNDIGSALARPFTARESVHLQNTFDPGERPTRPSTSRASPRVSRWLSGLLPTHRSQTPPPQQPAPFYKCVVPPPPSSTRQRRASSQASMPGSSVVSLDAPSLTAASSPTTTTTTATKWGHSRSLTAESRLTFRSPPPSTVHDHEVLEDVEEHWPVVVSRSQVGLAL